MAKPVAEAHTPAHTEHAEHAGAAERAANDAARSDAVHADDASPPETFREPGHAAAAERTSPAPLEAVLLELLSADADAFLRGTLAGLRRSAQTAPLEPELLRLGRALQRCVRDGLTEAEAYDELSDELADGAQAALPVLAAIAARAALEPLLAQGEGDVPALQARRLLGAATLAARRLSAAQGPEAVSELLGLASRIGRRAARRGHSARTLAPALARATLGVRSEPEPDEPHACEHAHEAAPASEPRVLGRERHGRPAPQRLRLNGPVEIVIYQR